MKIKQDRGIYFVFPRSIVKEGLLWSFMCIVQSLQFSQSFLFIHKVLLVAESLKCDLLFQTHFCHSVDKLHYYSYLQLEESYFWLFGLCDYLGTSFFFFFSLFKILSLLSTPVNDLLLLDCILNLFYTDFSASTSYTMLMMLLL